MSSSWHDHLFVRPVGTLAAGRAREDWVLEIGFGPGADIRRLSARAVRGFVAGIDWSPVMVEQASSRNHCAIHDGRVRLELGDATGRLPFA